MRISHQLIAVKLLVVWIVKRNLNIYVPVFGVWAYN